MNQLAPILLFTYKRLDALKKTVAALQSNLLAEKSNLFIFSDGAKSVDEVSVINDVRNYIRTVRGFKQINIIESTNNKGLANSIIQAVSEVLKTNESVIVLEDDLITTPNFLNFMNQGLNRYKEDLNVFSISGYSFDLGNDVNNYFDSYFLNRGASWGWATWKDRWANIDWDVKDYSEFKINRRKQREFNKGGSDLNNMLSKQMKGQIDSWAIRWFYHQYKVNGLTLYPNKSKVFNMGFDSLATHTKGSNKRYIPVLDTEHSQYFKFPEIIKISTFYQKSFQKKMSLLSRMYSKVHTLLINIMKLRSDPS